jgi:hypothetical protein
LVHFGAFKFSNVAIPRLVAALDPSADDLADAVTIGLWSIAACSSMSAASHL